MHFMLCFLVAVPFFVYLYFIISVVESLSDNILFCLLRIQKK